MASLLKKTFAVVLAIGMVVSCLTVNAATSAPSINVSTGYMKGTEETVSVKISTDSFTAIYGSHFSIKIPAGFTFASIATNDADGVEWVKDSNYVVNETDGVITFLDVRTDKGFDITLNLTKTGTPGALNPIELTPAMFVDSNEAVYGNVILNAGAISITNTAVSDGVIAEQEGYFVPYGSVITTDGGYQTKKEDGTFDSGTTVSYFKLPEENVGVTTFAVSEKSAEDGYAVSVEAGIQFGSYAIDTDGKELGTLVVMGELSDFRAKFADMTDEAFFNKLMGYCDTYLTGANAGKKIKLTEGDVTIRVGRVKRTTYMWKGTSGNVVGHRQYALRVINYQEDVRYSAIGYSKTDSAYTYSETVQTYKKVTQ